MAQPPVMDTVPELGDIMTSGRRIRWPAVVTAWLLAAAALAQPAAGQPPGNRSLLLRGQFAEFEASFAQQTAAAKRDANGELPSMAFFHSMGLGVDLTQWPQEDESTRRWLQQ